MAESIRELDLRTLPPARRHSEIFEAFGALAAGEGLVIINDHDPKPLLLQFQTEHPGTFEWSVLESGPDRYRIEIRRRSGDPQRTVSDYLLYDHRRLDSILSEVERLVRAGSFARAAEQFNEFSCGLRRHIEAEESVLFPAFERLTGALGPTRLMRAIHAQHGDIGRWIDSVAAALEARDATAFAVALEPLTAVLSNHHTKEADILYSATDRLASSPLECDDLVNRMQAI